MASEDWKEIDPSTLPVARKAAWDAAKEAYRHYKALRDTFEQGMQDDAAEKLPETHELKFGYKFGKLSIAIGPKPERKAKRKAAGSLGDFLNAQSEAGLRS